MAITKSDRLSCNPRPSIGRLDCSSETGRLRVVAMCRPTELSVDGGAEAEALGFVGGMDPTRAYEEWEGVCSVLREFGVAVVDLHEYLAREEQSLSDQLPNRIYTRDVAGVLGERLVLGRARAAPRTSDFRLHHQALRRLVHGDVKFSDMPAGEGLSLEFGDVLQLTSGALIVNAGGRTTVPMDETWVSTLADRAPAGDAEIAWLTVPDAFGYIHLDQCCNVAGRAIVAAGFLQHVPVRVKAGQVRSFTTLGDFAQRHGFSMYWLPVELTFREACNFLSVDPSTVLASATAPGMQDYLAELDVAVISVPLQELEMGGGGLRCMTLPLLRDRLED